MRFFGHYAADGPTTIGNWLTWKTCEQQFAFLRRHVRLEPATSILEIGPGRGEFATHFLQAGLTTYDVIEPDETLRGMCQQLSIRRAYPDVIPPLPVGEGTYDLVIMCDVFEHMNDTRMALAMLGEVHRVLKPGGHFFVLSPDYLHWSKEFFNCDFSHSNPTTVRRMKQLFFNFGLQEVATTYHYNYLSGIPGFVVGNLVKYTTAPLCFLGGNMDSRIYRLHLCFLRRFLMIGRKP